MRQTTVECARPLGLVVCALQFARTARRVVLVVVPVTPAGRGAWVAPADALEPPVPVVACAPLDPAEPVEPVEPVDWVAAGVADDATPKRSALRSGVPKPPPLPPVASTSPPPSSARAKCPR